MQKRRPLRGALIAGRGGRRDPGRQPFRERRRRRARRGPWIAGAFAVALVALIGFSIRNSADGGDFSMTAYHGAEALGGTSVSFDEVKAHAAGKPIVLNFWGGTCPPCRAEMPGFQNVYERHAEDVLVLGVDIGPFLGLGTRSSALRLLDELGITYPTAYAVDRNPVAQFQITGLPATYFFDGNGTLVDTAPGFINERDLETRVRELIGTSAASVVP